VNIDISKLTLQQKIGQLFLVSFDGTELSDETKAHFLKSCIGNYIYFAKNLGDYKKMRALSDSLQDTAKAICGIPAFISVDQEGGMVARVRTGSTHFPAGMAVTASGIPPEMVEQMGEMVGEGLINLGININHAPIADVNNNPNNPVIGARSYSDEPKVVSEIVSAYIKGIQKSGVLANAKHFPGHGDTDLDSHLDLPYINHDMDRLHAVELMPFKAAIACGTASIMSAHIVFKAIDPEHPATLSPKVINGLLRSELGFDGLVISDCMSMSAVKDHYTTPRGCVMAIKAGVDLICLNADFETQQRAVLAVHDAVTNGEIAVEVIDAALTRILKYKNEYLTNAAPQPREVYPAHEKLADYISERSITLDKSNRDILPLREKSVFVISTPAYRSSIANDDIYKSKAFASEAAEAFKTDYIIISRNPDEAEIAATLAKATNYDTILYAACNATHNRAQVRLFDALKAAGKTVVLVTLGLPYDISLMGSADVHIAAYEYSNRSVNATIKALIGEIEPTGRMPIRI